MWYRKSLVVGATAVLVTLAACTGQTAKTAAPPPPTPTTPPASQATESSTSPAAKTEKPAKPEPEQQFTRLTRDANRQPLALETAIVTYASPKGKPAGGPTVNLVAAVHVADGKYYDQLNEMFAKYNAVLYELVAPRGRRLPGGPGQPTSTPSPSSRR